MSEQTRTVTLPTEHAKTTIFTAESNGKTYKIISFPEEKVLTLARVITMAESDRSVLLSCEKGGDIDEFWNNLELRRTFEKYVNPGEGTFIRYPPSEAKSCAATLSRANSKDGEWMVSLDTSACKASNVLILRCPGHKAAEPKLDPVTIRRET